MCVTMFDLQGHSFGCTCDIHANSMHKPLQEHKMQADIQSVGKEEDFT